MPAKEKIIQRINEEGPISFHDFMEMALYCPGDGYYTSAKEKIGKNGDYYTSPCLGNIFGEMIAKQLEEMWCLLGKQPFHIIEYGAGNASLCNHILGYLQHNKEMYNDLTYHIIEKSAQLRAKEAITLHHFKDKMQWPASIKDITNVNGCIVSNELLDNFAVHQVIMQEELMEVFVDYNGGFTELLKPATASLKDHLQEIGITLPKGYRGEINLEAEEWLNEIADVLHSGFIITIDYGYSSAELYQRKNGTLLCYHKHSINDDPYINVGEQDITCHVNFSALLQHGSKNGLHCCGFTNQSNFLRSLGITEYLRKLEEKNKHRNSVAEVASTFTLLAQLGQKIKVLVQQKGLDHVSLSGMKFPLRLQ
jgi:SAM-dependent MidA family methyltransferase